MKSCSDTVTLPVPGPHLTTATYGTRHLRGTWNRYDHLSTWPTSLTTGEVTCILARHEIATINHEAVSIVHRTPTTRTTIGVQALPVANSHPGGSTLLASHLFVTDVGSPVISRGFAGVAALDQARARGLPGLGVVIITLTVGRHHFHPLATTSILMVPATALPPPTGV